MTEQTDAKALEEAKTKARKAAEKYAEKAGYILNPDTSVVETIVTGLANNKVKHGRAYCPCMFVSGNPEKDKTIICPCKVHKEDIEKQGKCHCGLFVKSN